MLLRPKKTIFDIKFRCIQILSIISSQNSKRRSKSSLFNSCIRWSLYRSIFLNILCTDIGFISCYWAVLWIKLFGSFTNNCRTSKDFSWFVAVKSLPDCIRFLFPISSKHFIVHMTVDVEIGMSSSRKVSLKRRFISLYDLCLLSHPRIIKREIRFRSESWGPYCN